MFEVPHLKTKNILLLTLLAFLFLFILCTTAQATNYYVSNDGADSNDGSIDHPWENISYVNAKMVDSTISAGDNIYFNRGDTFSDATLNLVIGGTSEDWMEIDCYGTGDLPEINLSSAAIQSTTADVDYVRIANLSVGGSTGTNNEITFTNDHQYISIFNVTVQDSAKSGMHIEQTYYPKVENCTIEDCGLGGIVFYGTTTHRLKEGIIRNCTITNVGTDTTSDCITIHTGDSTPSTQLVGENIWVENCDVSYATEDGIDITSGTNVLIENCKSHHNTMCGITFGSYQKNVTIQNCNFSSNTLVGINVGETNGVIVRNNIVYDSTSNSILDLQASSITWIENATFYNNNFMQPNGCTYTQRVFSLNYNTFKDVFFKNNIFATFDSTNPPKLYQ